MGAKHTPGPWEIVRVHLVPIGIGTRQQHHGAGVHCFRMLGNTLEHGDEEPDLDEVEANARLIAAAPDLLAACKELLGVIDHQETGDFQKECWCTETDTGYGTLICGACRARAAIAKAESAKAST